MRQRSGRKFLLSVILCSAFFFPPSMQKLYQDPHKERKKKKGFRKHTLTPFAIYATTSPSMISGGKREKKTR